LAIALVLAVGLFLQYLAKKNAEQGETALLKVDVPIYANSFLIGDIITIYIENVSTESIVLSGDYIEIFLIDGLGNQIQKLNDRIGRDNMEDVVLSPEGTLESVYYLDVWPSLNTNAETVTLRIKLLGQILGTGRFTSKDVVKFFEISLRSGR
jgi:hypothetical protein